MYKNNDDISLSNSMCYYWASMASTEFRQNLCKQSRDKKLMLCPVWRHPTGPGTYAGIGGSHSSFVGDFVLERILYSTS